MLRNKIAHASIYYDESLNDFLIFEIVELNNSFSKDDIFPTIQGVYDFLQYFIYSIIEKQKILLTDSVMGLSTLFESPEIKKEFLNPKNFKKISDMMDEFIIRLDTPKELQK